MLINSNILLVTLNIILFPIMANGEKCEAESIFRQFYDQSKNQLAEQKCIKISISEIYTPENHNMVYRWHMGDGEEEIGLDVSHCYEKYGKYTATLDALLPETEFISKNEMEVPVVIKESVKLNLKSPDVADIDQQTSFSFSLSPLITYEIDQVFWQIGENIFSCGEELNYQFDTPGSYPVKLLIRLKNLDGLFFLADQKMIEVEGFNIFGKEFEKLFQSQESPNPFLEDDIHLAFLNTSSQKLIQHTIQENDSLCFVLPVGQEFEMFLWRGNQYINPITFSTNEYKDSLFTFAKVRSVIINALSERHYLISPVSFDLNSTSLDRNVKKALRQNIKKLQQLEGFSIVIGSYTHTGGALEVNLAYADARSLLVKEYLQKKLQNLVRITIAEARKEKSLINTNYSTEAPDLENENLNGKTYLKIAGIE